MSNLSVFAFEGREVRFVGTPEKPEWVGIDVVAILYPDSRQKDRSSYLRHVPVNWKGLKKVQTPGGNQQVATVFEPGLYHLICRSNSPKAIAFQKWVYEEVLPAIRKTGTYSVKPTTNKTDFKADYSAIDPELRDYIQGITRQIKKIIKRPTHDAIQIGLKLLDVKNCLAHGQFLNWLNDEFKWSERQAQRFMAIAKTFGNTQDPPQVGLLSLALLSSKATPEEARTEIICRTEAGEKLSHAAVRRIVQKHKQPELPAEPPTKATLRERPPEPSPTPELSRLSQASPQPPQTLEAYLTLLTKAVELADKLGGFTEQQRTHLRDELFKHLQAEIVRRILQDSGIDANAPLSIPLAPMKTAQFELELINPWNNTNGNH